MPDVSILMGSDSDSDIVREAIAVLDSFGVSYECRVLSAHRAPRRLAEWVDGAPARGVKVFIAAAGGAAHLPGVVAALTTRPVIGLPIPSQTAASLDSILSILQMPGGVPVATVGAGKSGATNAGLLACQILALSNSALAKKLEEHKASLERGVLEKDQKLQGQLRPRQP
jgi:5-(carboxyamino)imidazole ribonucleotide mutase